MAAEATVRRGSNNGGSNNGGTPASPSASRQTLVTPVRRKSLESPTHNSTSPKSKDRDAKVPFQDILDTLGRQKQEWRKEHMGARGAVPSSRESRRRRQRLDTEADGPPLVHSGMHGSAKYSFGKPRHATGRFGILALEPRDMDYVKPTGGIVVPGPGHYKHSHTDGKDLAATEGHTGGWAWRNHNLFLKTLGEEYEDSAGPEFFDRMQFLLPTVARKDFADHLRWIADYHLDVAKRHLTMRRFVSQSLGSQAPPVDKKQQLQRERQAQMWHQQAAEEEARSALRDRNITFRNVQCFDGQVLDGNMRGHPEYRRAPGYTWSASRELRDPFEKQRTELSHVRSTSSLDVPGPGHYNLDKSPLLPRSASYTLHNKLPAQKVDLPALGGPGYDGALDASTRIQDDLRWLQNQQPAYSISRQERRPLHLPDKKRSLTATDPNIGPGRYRHVTSLHTQF